jgi:hypothetical protein
MKNPTQPKSFIVDNLVIQGYDNISELINKKPYPVSIPSNINTPQVYMWSDGTFSTQLYEPMFNSLVPSKRTINELIEFCFNRIDFKLYIDIYGRHPIFEIEWAVRTFLKECNILETRVQFRTDPEAQSVKSYLFKAKEAYKIFNKMFLKALAMAKLPDHRIHPMDKLFTQLRGAS